MARLLRRGGPEGLGGRPLGKTFVSELAPGQRVESRFAVVRREMLPFKDSARGGYLLMVPADRTGQTEARKWENARLHIVDQGGSGMTEG